MKILKMPEIHQWNAFSEDDNAWLNRVAHCTADTANTEKTNIKTLQEIPRHNVTAHNLTHHITVSSFWRLYMKNLPRLKCSTKKDKYNAQDNSRKPASNSPISQNKPRMAQKKEQILGVHSIREDGMYCCSCHSNPVFLQMLLDHQELSATLHHNIIRADTSDT